MRTEAGSVQDHPEPAIAEPATEIGPMTVAREPATEPKPDMRALVGFHIAGVRAAAGANAPASTDLAPALLAGYREHAHRVYGADLLGAGVGCIATLGLLGAMSAPSTLLVTIDQRLPPPML